MSAVASRRLREELEGKLRPVADKLAPVEAAMRLVGDGDHLAIGGTLYSRTPMALLFELLRQGRAGLTLSRPLTCYEAELFLVAGAARGIVTRDRKSTRLNSSHVSISYAVFCLNKKTKLQVLDLASLESGQLEHRACLLVVD